MTTLGEVISRIRSQVKAVSQDAFVTDRYIYSLVLKYAQLLMKREDGSNKLMRFNSVFKVLPYVELIEVDKVQAQCTGIKSGCIIMRSKQRLPEIMNGYWGPIIRTVSSIDGSIDVQPTQASIYVSMTKTTTFKYNESKYYWYLDGYIYIPNVEWDAVQVESIFTGSIQDWLCPSEATCSPRYEQDINIPDGLLAEIEQQVLTVMMNTIKIPVDDSDNKINLLR